MLAELMQIIGTLFTIIMILIMLHWALTRKYARQRTEESAVPEAKVVEVKETVMEDVQFTVNVRDFIKALLNDPKCREEIYSAVREGAGIAKVPVGYSNLGSPQNHENQAMYFSVSNEKPIGAEGCIHRTKDGRRVLINLVPHHDIIKDALLRNGDPELAAAIEKNPGATKKILESLGYR